jgi:ketosteroid isomerase-like protein
MFTKRSSGVVPSASDNREIVRSFWTHLRRREWERAGALLAEDFVAAWPHARERIRGRERFLDFVENYPGDWEVTIRRIVADEEQAVADLIVEDHEGTFYVAWFYELRAGRIARGTEYWIGATDEEIPEWRAPWAERY